MNTAKSITIAYTLSRDGAGLMRRCISPRTGEAIEYHVHADDMSADERKIHRVLSGAAG